MSAEPAVARRRLRLALRRLREAKGLTQAQVADALGWSLSKVNRIENGDVTLSNTDLRAYLALLDFTDHARIEQMAADAKVSRRRSRGDRVPHREFLTAATTQLLQFENEATAIRAFQSTMIPGLLQTRAYAEFVIGFWSDQLGEADRRARVDTRVQRREQVFGRAWPPQYLLILDESVLSREVGGPRIMAEQLHELLNAGQQRRVQIRVVPLARAAVIAMLGPFTIIDLVEDENAVLYRESPLADEIVHAPETINWHRQIFDQMWAQSLDEAASERMIRARAAAMLSALDMRQSGG